MSDGFLTIDGVRLEYRSLRPAAAVAGSPVLMLLHEGLGCVGMWRHFPERLAEGTRCAVFALSRAGYGRSDPVPLPRPLDYHERETAMLPKVLAAAGIGRHLLIGHSDGGTIALLAAAARSPRPAQAIVTMAAHVFVEEVSIAGIIEARHGWEHGDLRPRLERWHDGNVECAFLGWCDTWLDPRFRDWNIEHRLRDVRVPALVMQGAHDHYGTPAQVEAIAGGVAGPVRTLMVDGAGHAPHLERPEAVIAAIAAFLAALPPAGAAADAGGD